MAFWTASSITSNKVITSTPDSGNGDTLYNAFTKVNDDLVIISNHLGQTSIDFYSANVQVTLNTNYVNTSNLFVSNATGNTSSFRGNSTTGNLIANTSIYVQGQSNFYGNLNISGNIVPTAYGQYNLGSAENPFKNLYVQTTVSTTQINASSDSGLLLVHANANPGDTKDVGIFGNVTSNYGGANTYSFFGHQYSTNDFVYKITNTNAFTGNNVVYDGFYGNVHFGSAFLSNSTISSDSATGALIVTGGAGIGGNINTSGNLTVSGNTTVTGNIFSGGYQVLTTNTPGLNNVYSGGANFNTPVTILAGDTSSSTGTGALIVSYGGVGVAGNVYAGAFYGPLVGTIQTAAQPNITSVGTLPTLTVGTLNFTSIGGTGGTFTTINTGSLTGLPILTVSGNVNANHFNANAGVYASYYYGSGANISNLVSNPTIIAVNANMTAANATISTFQANVGAYYTWANANAALQSSQITGANAAIVTANTAMKSYVDTQITATTNSWTANAATQASQLVGANAAIVTANTAMKSYVDTQITATTNSWTSNAASQQGTINTLSSTSSTHTSQIATLQSQVYSNANASSYLGIHTGSVNGSLTAAAQGSITQTGILTGLTVSAAIIPNANTTVNLGSTSAWWNNIYGTAIHALYADLAERYTADAVYEPGTVVVFGGEKEITVTNEYADARVAGAISTDPAYLMNGGIDGLPVALRGRVPVKVIGPVTKGDSLVTAGANPGYAISVGKDKTFGQAVFAKALETNHSDGIKVIESVIL